VCPAQTLRLVMRAAGQHMYAQRALIADAARELLVGDKPQVTPAVRGAATALRAWMTVWARAPVPGP